MSQETESGFPVSVQESQTVAWVHSLASGQTTEREHSPTHQQKIELKIYRTHPPPQSEQDPTSTTVIVSHQEASISLLNLFLRRQTE